MGNYKIALIFLLLTGTLHAQIDPPSKVVKKRHGQSATLSWSYDPSPDFVLQYFSVKSTYNLNSDPVEIEQVPPTATSKTISVQFTPQFPDLVYYVITGVYQGTGGRVESFNSRTVAAQRQGKPPQ